MFRVVSLGLTFIAIVLAWHSEPSHHLIIGLSIQSHHLFSVWHSEPPSSSVWHSEWSSLQFGVQSHHHFSDWHSKPHFSVWRSEPPYPYSSAFRATIPCLVQHSEPSCLFSVWCSESYFQFNIQSRIFNLAFKAAFSFWRSESHLQFGVQSRCLVLVRNSESSYHLHFGVQSRCLFLVRHSNSSCLLFVRRLESHLHLGIQSHIFSLVFRAIVCL